MNWLNIPHMAYMMLATLRGYLVRIWVIRHLLLAPNRVYYLIDGEQVVIMGIVHVKRSPQAVTSMIKRFLEEYDK